MLLALKANGVDYLFANAGTDFPPIIEALASLDPDFLPQAVTVPHETASMAMAHGYYLATGQAQAGDRLPGSISTPLAWVNAAHKACESPGLRAAISRLTPIRCMIGNTPVRRKNASSQGP